MRPSFFPNLLSLDYSYNLSKNLYLTLLLGIVFLNYY